MATEREDELLRLNAELAAEIRKLGSGEVSVPRSNQAPAARHLSRLQVERDELRGERDELRGERDRLQAQLEQRTQDFDSLGKRLEKASEENVELAHEVHRLRSGVPGWARRVRAKLLRRR